MATAIINSSSKEGHECPICLGGFTSPRELPCLHSFCEHCLQDYITKKASSTEKAFEEFMCPVCRAVTRPANKETPVGKWSSLFPNSPFPLVGKSKVERPCEVCLNSKDSSANLAKKLCVVCEEFMCDNCAVYHQKMKMSRTHHIITIEELENNPENHIRLRGGFGCPEHTDEDIKFYCRSHEAAFCGTCLFHNHKSCQNVLELKQGLPHLLNEMNPRKIMEQIQKIENHIKTFMEMNEENIGILESRVNNISAEIGDIRKKLNAVLDDIERMVKLEGNRIYKEWLIRKQEQNHQCQSLLSAIRNSQALLEATVQFGSDTQKFLVTSKTMKQLRCYSDQISENFARVDNIRISLELDSNMKAILSEYAGGLVKIACQEEAKDLPSASFMVPLQNKTAEFSRVIDVHRPSNKNPEYLCIVQLPNGNIVLADSANKACCLYDSSCNLITSHMLPENPYGMCLIGDNEVAVTMPDKNTVQFLSISDYSMRETGAVRSRYACFGVDAVSREEFLVSSYCAAKQCSKCMWSLISRNGNVKLHHGCSAEKAGHAYAALNMSKSRVYISVTETNAVYCFGLTDGKQYFVYLSKDLKSPRGVAVDREDNIYVVGYSSNNIHKLSPDGVTLQVITSGVPERPQGISFNHSRDHFIIINEGQMSRKLYYFVHK